MEATFTQTDTQKINTVFKEQLQNAPLIGQSTVSERREKLQKLEKAIIDRQDEIIEVLNNDFGKPSFETLLSEITTLISEIRHTRKHLAKWMRPKRLKRFMTIPTLSGKIEYKSKGVCLILSPWNYPFYLAISPLISAIAAGNSVILKPSELTPHTSAFIDTLITTLFDENEVFVAQGDAKVAQYLTALPFHHIFFTGSPQVGKLVMEAAAKNLCSVTLELGGKSPAIVSDSALIPLAAKRILFGKYINAGQTCIAPDYILVSQSKQDELIEALQKQAEQFVKETTQSEPNYSLIITERHAQRFKNLLEDALEKGAKLTLGGTIHPETREAELTILTEVTPSMKIMQEEIFGPILPVLSYKKIEDVIDFVNQLERPLSSYIFTQNNKEVSAFSNQIRAGAVLQNDTILHIGHPHAPFGGVNNSGLGNSHGWYGFNAFSHEQPVLKNSKWSPMDLFHPPYKAFHIKMIKKIIRWM